MQILLTLRDYLNAMIGCEAHPLDLPTILYPFDISFISQPDDSLCTGSFLQVLALEFEETEIIDPMDVAQVANSLGYLPAEAFLEIAPKLMAKAIKSGCAAYNLPLETN